MNRALALLPLLPLALAACSTKNVPLVGSDQPPDGTLPLDGVAALRIQAAMELDMPHTFRFRFNGKYGVLQVATGGPWIYLEANVEEWAGGPIAYGLIPAGVYTVEMVDESDTTWGQTPPITIQQLGGTSGPGAVIFVHLDGVQETWILDQGAQDGDPATLEATISNLSSVDVPVARCQLDSGVGGTGSPQGCTSLGSVAPRADFQTTQTRATDTMPTTVPILSVGSFQESLVSSEFGGCQIDRIVVTGTRTLRDGSQTRYAFSACQGI
jgi:hypothetical protein